MTPKEMWLVAPDGQFADDLKWIVQEWNDIPTALQVLKALDYAVYTGGASTFAMRCLHVELKIALEAEGTTHEHLEKSGLAIWRDGSPFNE
jgi:hypothetical protein